MPSWHDIQKQCYCQDTVKEMPPSLPEEQPVVYSQTLNSSLLRQQTDLMQDTPTYHISLCLRDLVSEPSFVIYAVAIFILFKSFMIAWVNLPLFQLAITIPTIHWQLWNERVSSPMNRIPQRKLELDIYHLSYGPFHLCACRCVHLLNEWLSEIKWNPCVQTFLASLC